jgi:hypothetical protein
MNKLVLLASLLGTSLLVAGCTGGPSTGSLSGTVMSCFQGSKTGQLACIDTPAGPQTRAEDVDDDGTDDAFVCADRDSDDDGTPDFEDSHDDSADDATDDHGGTVADDHDGDGDGVDDDHDCGHGSGSGSGSV